MRSLALALVLCSCALTSKAAPIDIRYFSPETLDGSGGYAHEKNALALRLGRVTSSENLRSRIVHRDSEFQLAEYEVLRWTEDPQAYVARALVRALFEDGPLQQGVGGPLPTLDVEVTVFEEVRRGPRRGGRVQLRYQIHDDRLVLTSGSVTVEREATTSDIEPVVAAIGTAMRDASVELSHAIYGRLDGLHH